VTAAAVLDVSDHTATEASVEATRTPSPSSNTISHTAQRSCSELLYDYMRAAIYAFEDELPDHNSIWDECRMLRLYHKPTRDLLSYEPVFRMFVQYTAPKDDLYNVVRAFDTADDMVFLRRLLLTANESAASGSWMIFFEHLLLYAAEDGNECLVVMLLDVGVDIHFSQPCRLMNNFERYTAFNALQFAVHGGYQNLINILTSHGATIFSCCSSCESEFLLDAITRNTIDFAKPLLAKAATSDIKIYHKGIEVFRHAVEQSYDKIIDLLFDAGFNPHFGSNRELSTQWGRDFASAFMDAVHGSKTGYLERFLNTSYHSLDKEQCKERLRQLLAGYVFAHRSDNVALKSAILPHMGLHPEGIMSAMGYDVMQQYLYDALEEAVRRPDCVKVKSLIEMGANPNHPRDMSVSWYADKPLELAVSRGNVDIVRQLIAAGADVTLSNPRTHETPLKVAASKGSFQVVSLLVEAGAEVDVSTFMTAAQCNIPMLSCFLGSHGQGRISLEKTTKTTGARHIGRSCMDMTSWWSYYKAGRGPNTESMTATRSTAS